jgi:predicted DNA binding protein
MGESKCGNAVGLVPHICTTFTFGTLLQEVPGGSPMKRVRVTIHPGEADLPLTYDEVTSADEPPVNVEVLNWNITAIPATFLLRVRGDIQQFGNVLERDDAVEEFELLQMADRECYCFVRGEGSADARALWETFKQGSLMTVPPATWNNDGSYTFTVVGTDADIQAAMETAQKASDDIPDSVQVDIEAVGSGRVAPELPGDRLANRQREALATAVDLGYYRSPREATVEDVARELDCAPSTAAEHLRKAEAAVIGALFT